MVLDIWGDEELAIKRDQVCHTVNCINMDNLDVGLVLMVEAWVHHPHAGILVRLIPDTSEPTNDSTWIVLPLEVEGKER